MRSRPTERSGIVTSIGLVGFFLFVSVYTMGLSQADDSWYLSDGVSLQLSHFFGLHYWSPLYLLWLRLLSYVWRDPVSRYFASWVLLTLLVTLIPTVLKVRYAWVYAVLVVVSGAPYVQPYIGMFAGVIALLAMCVVLRARVSVAEALAASCFTCVVLGYCRPEFDYGVFLAAIAALAVVGGELRSSAMEAGVRRRLKVLAVGVVVLSGMTMFVMHRALGQRSGIAFAQHFNRRAALRRILPYTVPSWQSDYAERVFGVDVTHNASNGTATLGDFFRAKPGLFLGHVFDNLLDPVTVVVLLLVVGALAWPWLRADAKLWRPASLFLAVIVAAPLMDMAVIYPREHYVMILLPSVTIFALQAIRTERWLKPPLPWVLIAGIAVIAYVNIEIPRQRWDPPSADQVMLSQVQCLRAVDRSVPAAKRMVFDSVGIRDVYLTTQRKQVDQWTLAHWDDFKGWTVAEHPAWVTVDTGLASHYGTTPEQVQTFLAGELGYVAHSCPVTAGMTIYTPKAP